MGDDKRKVSLAEKAVNFTEIQIRKRCPSITDNQVVRFTQSALITVGVAILAVGGIGIVRGIHLAKRGYRSFVKLPKHPVKKLDASRAKEEKGVLQEPDGLTRTIKKFLKRDSDFSNNERVLFELGKIQKNVLDLQLVVGKIEHKLVATPISSYKSKSNDMGAFCKTSQKLLQVNPDTKNLKEFTVNSKP